ncbi:MAG: hypothetical protein Q8L14_15780 [Myxococcales bacterium]|nr:hypothetical protein [Myxococcales bacterium]
MSHPSIFELSRFIEAGAETDAFEAHVSACDTCASQLSRLAHRSMLSQGLSAHVVVPSRRVSPALAGFVALTACVAALIAQPSRAAMTPGPSGFTMLAPEGVHGTPFTTEPDFARLERTGFADAGLSSPAP